MKNIAEIFGFFVAAFLLNGILTNDNFEWWFVPIAVVSALYMIAFAIVTYRKVKHHIW